MQEHLNKNEAKGHAASAIRLDISVLRVLGCLMIVWYHAGLPYHDLAYSGLIVFIVISIYLLRVSVRQSVSIWVDAQKRARRILLPWIFWSLAYGVFLFRPGKPGITSMGEAPQLLLVGGSIHLWYLPFIWLVLLLVQFLIRHVEPFGIWLTCETFVLLGLLTSPTWRTELASLGAPWGQYLHASLAVAMGTVLLVSPQIPTQLAISGVLLNLMAAIYVVRVPGIGVPYAVGALVCLSLMRRTRFVSQSSWINMLANSTFGVYLTHIFFLRLAWRWGQHGAMGFVTAIAMSFAVVMLARRLVPALRTVI